MPSAFFESPLASYLVTVNIANFVGETDQGPNGLPIRNYFPPGVAADGRRAVAACCNPESAWTRP